MDKRVYGNFGVALIECINPKYRKYRVRWDVQPYTDEDGNQRGVSFVEAEFKHKPTMAEVKDAVLGWMNAQIDAKILSGFVWNEMSIWLSTENQFNYKAAYDLAVQTQGASLPVTFKFGDTDSPEYHTFSRLEELADFYMQAMAYINGQLAKGWEDKDAVDWSGYEKLLIE